MNRSGISHLLNLLVFRKYFAYLICILLAGTLGFAYSVRPYHLKRIPIVNSIDLQNLTYRVWVDGAVNAI